MAEAHNPTARVFNWETDCPEFAKQTTGTITEDLLCKSGPMQIVTDLDAQREFFRDQGLSDKQQTDEPSELNIITSVGVTTESAYYVEPRLPGRMREVDLELPAENPDGKKANAALKYAASHMASDMLDHERYQREQKRARFVSKSCNEWKDVGIIVGATLITERLFVVDEPDLTYQALVAFALGYAADRVGHIVPRLGKFERKARKAAKSPHVIIDIKPKVSLLDQLQSNHAKTPPAPLWYTPEQ